MEDFTSGKLDRELKMARWREVNGLQANNLNEDPRFVAQRNALHEAWKKANPGASKHQEDRAMAGINKTAEAAFRKGFPKDAAQYDSFGLHLDADGNIDANADPLVQQARAAVADGSNPKAWDEFKAKNKIKTDLYKDKIDELRTLGSTPPKEPEEGEAKEEGEKEPADDKTPKDEKPPDERDAEIARLKAELATANAAVANLTARVGTLEESNTELRKAVIQLREDLKKAIDELKPKKKHHRVVKGAAVLAGVGVMAAKKAADEADET